MKTNMKRYLLSKHQNESENNEKQEMTSSSTDLASHGDVLMEILLRLPIRSLLRSKCVSKQWRAAISDHRFSLLRSLKDNPPSGLFLQRIHGNVNKEYDFVSLDCESLDFKPPFKTLNFEEGSMVLHSCKGLMLCHRLHEYFCNDSKQIVYYAMYYVYNPTINKYISLPKFEGKGAERRPRGLTLAFDPLKSPYYMVICVIGFSWSEHLYDIGIYSSESKSWRRFEKPFSSHIDTEFTGGVYWNNAVHWINKKGFVLYLKIDDNEGSLDEISIPVSYNNGWNVKRHCYPLVESRDCLLFIDTNVPQSSMQFDVYEMDRDYSGWTVKYHVDLNQMTSKFPEMTDATRSVYGVLRPRQSFVIHCLVLGKREEDSFIVLEIPGKAIRYNIMLKTYQQLCELKLCRPSRLSVGDDGFSKLGRWPGAFLFVESLTYV
uniref:F-box protein At5g07610-like n=1 Tax=Erigeron canadensis TaxID=72917 RepID=UPI001CB98853|nr:F-box protein At5g07610-like [Erigeron canadensis]